MQLLVEGFEDGGRIPAEFTCDGEDRSPAVSWNDPPEGTLSLALALDDPDAPSGTFTHWIVYNISPEVREILGKVPEGNKIGTIACQGANDFGTVGYRGPCPPPGKPHTYIFHLYALDSSDIIKPAMGRTTLKRGYSRNIIEEAVYRGVYGRD